MDSKSIAICQSMMEEKKLSEAKYVYNFSFAVLEFRKFVLRGALKF